MDSAFERPAWIWNDATEEPVPIDPADASREELAEALENTRREMYELEQDLSHRIERLQRELERLGTPQPSHGSGGAVRSGGTNGHG